MTATDPASLQSFRELYERIIRYEGVHLFRDVLEPVIPQALKIVEPLHRYQHRPPLAEVRIEDTWTFFALSVINDYLLLPLKVNRDEYLRFFTALGFQPFEGGDFSPVRHEIVAVGNWVGREEGIRIGGAYWPGLMFGGLVFSRSAVSVLCHPDFQILKGIADRSPLYFTHLRMQRATEDLSRGWGSNSRWRTSFRFDYEEPEFIVFNALGQYDLAAPESLGGPEDANEELPVASRRELLVHRCFVSHNGRWDDWFPYGDTLMVRRSAEPWPLREATLVRRHERL